MCALLTHTGNPRPRSHSAGSTEVIGRLSAAGSNQVVDRVLCRLCAADLKCSAYNWANNAVADPQDADKVFLCHKLHDVHPGVDGWELGVRAGRAYDSPYKQRSALM